MADIKIKHIDDAGVGTVVEITGLDCGADVLTNSILEKLGHSGASADGTPGGMVALASNHELEAPLPYNMRAVRPRHITPETLKEAIREGRLDEIIRPFDEIDIPLDTGGTVTAVCGYSDSCAARFVLKDCWDEAVMNEGATNKGGYFKSKGRAHVLVDILPHIAQEWRAIFKPRKMAEIIDGERVEYEDLVWLPSATDVFGPSENGWWKDEDDSFRLAIFDRERDRVKECGDNGTYPYWLRSVYAGGTSHFCLVATSGSALSNSAYISSGFAPGFDI